MLLFDNLCKFLNYFLSDKYYGWCKLKGGWDLRTIPASNICCKWLLPSLYMSDGILRYGCLRDENPMSKSFLIICWNICATNSFLAVSHIQITYPYWCSLCQRLLFLFQIQYFFIILLTLTCRISQIIAFCWTTIVPLVTFQTTKGISLSRCNFTMLT